jgi:hypothetical protein
MKRIITGRNRVSDTTTPVYNIRLSYLSIYFDIILY